MAAIGIDSTSGPSRRAACGVDEVGGVIDERTFSCDPAGFLELAAWAGGVAPEIRIGIEGSASYGAPWPTTSWPPGSPCARFHPDAMKVIEVGPVARPSMSMGPIPTAIAGSSSLKSIDARPPALPKRGDPGRTSGRGR